MAQETSFQSDVLPLNCRAVSIGTLYGGGSCRLTFWSGGAGAHNVTHFAWRWKSEDGSENFVCGRDKLRDREKCAFFTHSLPIYWRSCGKQDLVSHPGTDHRNDTWSHVLMTLAASSHSTAANGYMRMRSYCL